MNVNVNLNKLNSITTVNPVTDGIGEMIPEIGVKEESMAVSHGFSKVNVNNIGVGGVDLASKDGLEVLKEQAHAIKENMTNLINKLSITDVKKMSEEGDDILDADVDEVIDVVKRIKIMLTTYCEDYVPTGDINIDDIKSESADALTAAKVVKKLNSSNLPVTKDNVKKIINSVKEYQKLSKVTESGKRYLLSKELPATIENMSIASSISGANPSAISDADLAKLGSQIENAVVKAGFTPDEDTIFNAKMILQEGKGIDKDMLSLAKHIDGFDYELSEDGVIELAIDEMNKELNIENIDRDEIKRRSDIIVAASIEEIICLVNADEAVNVSNLSKDLSGYDNSVHDDLNYEYERNFVFHEYAKATLNANVLMRLESVGVDTLNTSLEDLVYRSKGVLSPKEKSDIIRSGIEKRPIETLALTYGRNMHADATIRYGLSVQYRMQVAMKSYETFETQIRGDLGDNLNSAVKASASLLEDMGLEADKANMAALKIISYGQLELSEQNVVSIASDYTKIMNVINNISPKAVMKMIEDGEDVFTMDLDELERRVTEDAESLDKEDFAKYLYKLDRAGLDEDKRREYISIYRAFDRIRRDGVKSLGDVVRADRQITTQNLVGAYISRRDAGLDIFSDEYVKVDYDYYRDRYEHVKEALDSEENVVAELLRNDMPVTVENLWMTKSLRGKDYFNDIAKDDEKIAESLETIFSDMDDEEKLNMAFDRTLQAADEALKADYSLRLDEIVRSLQFATGQKGREYHIPLKKGDEFLNVDLKVVKGENKGRMSINIQDGNDRYSADISVTKTVEALIICDNDEKAALVKERKDALIDSLTEEGFFEARVDVTVSSQMTELMTEYKDTYEEGTLKLYRVAKLFIECMAG